MTITKRITSLALAAVLLLTSVLLWGCGSSEIEYKVNVTDALGTPYTSGIVVKFMQNGEQVALQACDENGVAAKTLPKGNYEAELSFTADAETAGAITANIMTITSIIEIIFFTVFILSKFNHIYDNTINRYCK